MAKWKTWITGTAAAGLLAATLPLTADQHGSGDDALKAAANERHQLMEIVGTSFGSIGKILKGELEGDANIANYSRIMLKAASLAPAAFSVDTRSAGLDTEAKDAIWENWDDFAAKAGDFGEALTAFNTLAKAGAEKKELGKAFAAVGKTCKACHDDYKTD